MELTNYFHIFGIVVGLILPSLWIIEKTCRIIHFLIKLARFVKEMCKTIYGCFSFRNDDGLNRAENQQENALEVGEYI